MSLVAVAMLVFGLTSAGLRFVPNALVRRFQDIPNERSSHTAPTPRTGGLIFVGAFFVGLLILAAGLLPSIGAVSQKTAVGIVLVLGPLWLIGILDDANGVSARYRYLVHLVSAGLAFAWFGQSSVAGDLLRSLGPSWFAGTVVVLAITALINFYNFMDGLDGMVGGTSAAQLGFFAWYLHQPVWWLLAAALLAFLLWNWPPAKVFMGDSGSTVLGGAAAIALLRAPDAKSLYWAAAVTLPIVGDAAYTLLRRSLRRENIFSAHKSHIYQRLNQSGWSHRRVSATYVALTVAIAAIAAKL